MKMDCCSNCRGEGENKMGKSELRDGMRIDWDVPITLDDGVVLRATLINGRGWLLSTRM
jgi:hypothetical protein